MHKRFNLDHRSIITLATNNYAFGPGHNVYFYNNCIKSLRNHEGKRQNSQFILFRWL